MNKKKGKEVESRTDIEKNGQDISKKSNLLVIVLMFLLGIALGTGIWYISSKDKENNSHDSDEVKEELNYKMPVYTCDGAYITQEKVETCQDVYIEVPTKTEKAQILAVYNGEKEEYTKFVLYEDEVVKIFNTKTQEITKLDDFKNEYDAYELNINSNHDEVEGIIYKNVEEKDNLYNQAIKLVGYYNIKNNQKMYEGKYTDLRSINENYLEGYVYNDELEGEAFDENYTIYLLSAENEKEYLTDKNVCSNFDEVITNGNRYLIKNGGCLGSLTTTFYNKDYQPIVEDLESYQYDIDKDGNLLVLNNDEAITYNVNGVAIHNYKLEGKALSIYKDGYLTIIDNKLYMKEYNDNKYLLGDWKEDYYYHWKISGYFDAESVEENKKAGYYFIIGLDGENENGGGYEYYYNPQTKEVDGWELEMIGGYDKPVLYLYPQDTTDVEVNFEHEENLTTTYPKFKDSWQVEAHNNGNLYDKNGKYYYALYWEEKKNHNVSFDTGYYVTKDNAINFLEEKLTLIGLNDKEKNEFIMYWLPILENNEQSLVYFELTQERESYNKIQITPQPDSLLRMAIHVKKVNKPVNIPPQHLEKFERKGFVAVEWGGVIYK